MKFMKLKHTNVNIVHKVNNSVTDVTHLILTNASIGLSSWNSETVVQKQYTLIYAYSYT